MTSTKAIPPNRFLDDIKVLDLSQYIPGPFATRQLADLGANVIKIEAPNGDPMRHFMSSEKNTPSPIYKHLNRGKRIFRLDLKSDAGRQKLTALLKDADVLLESYRPGVLARLGFGTEALKSINATLIHCALSGYGQSGPYRLRAGHDINYCAASGALAVSGVSERPVITFPPIADHAGAMQASTTILAALYARQRNGMGATIDLSLFEASLSWQYLSLSGQSNILGQGLLTGGAACYNIYQCKDDAFISLGAIETPFWTTFCQTVKHNDWINRYHEAMPQKDLIGDLSVLFAQQTRVYWDGVFASVDCCYQALLLPEEVNQFAQAVSRQSVSKSGPNYPGHINGNPVPVELDYIELTDRELAVW